MKEDNSLGEAAIDYRDTILLPVAHGHALHEVKPVCFTQQPYLGEALAKMNKAANEHDEVRAILHQDIDCDRFIIWEQGFSPKEHWMMEDRDRLRKWQAEREDADRRWREQQENKDREWRGRQEFLNRTVTVVAAAVGSVLVVLLTLWLLRQ